MAIFLVLVKIIVGLVLLLIGGEALVRGAVALAKHTRVPTLIIGLTVVAVGTSAPELVVSFKAAFSGHPDITVGNIIGSNISNILLILGSSALIAPLVADKRIRTFDAIALCAITALFILFSFLSSIGVIAGAVFTGILVFYTHITIRYARRERPALPEHQIEEVEELIPIKLSFTSALLITIAGIATLILGADILISGAIELARILGLAEAVIAVTIIALGSSLPELAACTIAAYRNHADIAIGNVIGSNLINILAGIGFTALFIELPIAEKFLTLDMWYLLAATGLLTLILQYRPHINKVTGGLFFLGYIGYIALQFYR